MQAALVAAWERLAEVYPGAGVRRHDDLLLAHFPGVPLPQFNGPWVLEDSARARAALDAAIDEAAATGETPWVQTRSGQDRAHETLRELGLVDAGRMPGMVVLPDELVEPAPTDIEIDRLREHEYEAVTGLLAASFGVPHELFAQFCRPLVTMTDASWYVGRRSGEPVSTAFAFSAAGATGIYNVATLERCRGRGYGAALTAHAVREGFSAGDVVAYLQSSEIGHGVYRRLGFRDVEEYILFARP